tara:strand:- start:368 stop:1711 length:1344 start_codon:yes stop_codon:yes gene_type:complete
MFSWLLFFYYRKTIIENYDFNFTWTLIVGTIGVTFFWIILYTISGNYIDVRRVSRLNEFLKTLLQSIIGCLLLFFFLIIDDFENYTNYFLYYKSLLALFIFHFSLTYFFRFHVAENTIKKIKKGVVKFNTLLIGDSDSIIESYNVMKKISKTTGNHIVGYLEYSNKTLGGLELKKLGDISNLNKVLNSFQIEEVILNPKKNDIESNINIINDLIYNNIITKIPSDVKDLISGKIKMQSFFDTPYIEIKQIKMLHFESFFKRFLDLLVSILALLVLSPLLVFISVAVKLSSEGPIFYFQERLGINSKPFNIIKFRSMKIDAEAQGPLLSSKNDQRITKWGKIMRKYRLDELPQFYNVLIGEMSLIGPRPERKYFAEQIIIKAPQYKLIYKVKPGITSWGMVKFGYAENVEEMIKRLRYDLIYLENLSLISDFKVFILTIIIILQGRGK